MQRAGSRRSPQKGRSVEMHHATYYRDHYRSNYSDNVYTQNVGIHPQPVSFNAYFSLESASFNDSTSAFNGDYEDFQNFTVENDFQDTKMQLPSLNSSFNSFNSCKMKASRDFSHPAFDPSQERHRHSPPGRESFQQMEWENRKIRGMKYDVNEYLGYGDGQVNQHDRHVGKNVTEHHGSAENQDYSISLTAQADDSWGSWSSISDRSRLCWVHDDGESLPKYPLSPSPPPFRTPYSVAAVRPQHTRSHPDLFEQNERDGSCCGSSLRSCGLVNSRLWPPPLPALDHLAAPRRWDDLADGYRPSTPVFFHDVPPNRLLSSPGVMKSFCVMPLVASAACECTGRQLGVIALRRAIVPSVQPGIRLHKGTIALRDDPLPSPQRACARSYVNVRAGACCGGGGYAPRPPPPAPSFPPNPRARTCTRAHASLPPTPIEPPARTRVRGRGGACARALTRARPTCLLISARELMPAWMGVLACLCACLRACLRTQAAQLLALLCYELCAPHLLDLVDHLLWEKLGKGDAGSGRAARHTGAPPEEQRCCPLARVRAQLSRPSPEAEGLSLCCCFARAHVCQ